MKKFLLTTVASLMLVSQALAASEILTWTAPAASSATLTAIQIWDTGPMQPPVNIMIGNVGPTATTFTTGQLAAGQHTFTAVAVYTTGSAAPSNSVIQTFTVTLPPVTNLTGTVGP